MIAFGIDPDINAVRDLPDTEIEQLEAERDHLSEIPP